MSSPPPARRRRIAGERRRPPSGEAGPPADEGVDDVSGDVPAAPVPGDDVAPTPPPPVARPAAGTSVDGQRRSRSIPRPGPLDAVFGGLALLGVGVIAVLLLGLPQPVRALGVPAVPDLRDVREAEVAQTAAETAPSVAERAAGAILAYDHRNLDADQDAAQRFMTTSFAEEYAATFDESVEPAARTYRAQVTSEVKGASVVRASPDRVLVLLFVDQTTRSTAHDGPQLALNRVEFEMVKSDGDWLVDGISSY